MKHARPVLGVKEWLWVSASEKFCLFHAGDTRLSSAELEKQLGTEFKGVLSSDDGACLQRLPRQGATEVSGTSETSFQKSGQVRSWRQPGFRASLFGLD